MINAEDRQHLMNIVEAINEIDGYVQYEEYNDFVKDNVATEAVARSFQDISGAAKLLSEEFTSNYSDIDWVTLIRLEDARYNEAMEYGYEELWNIIKYDLPKIKDEVTDLASNLEETEDIEGFDLTPDDPNTY